MTIVVVFDDVVGETEFEIDSKSDAGVETGVSELLEIFEVIEVVGAGVGEDVNVSGDVGIAEVDGKVFGCGFWDRCHGVSVIVGVVTGFFFFWFNNLRS